ncbi:MAG: helix-turn-helix domain-containing protein [Clostridiales bacterium]|nr:helix-turn-helix domain-containing protein [Clostridiales bacterium]
MNITEFIKTKMDEQGITYEQLAAEAGVGSRQNLWDKLNRREQPNFGTVKKILAGLGYDIVIQKDPEATEDVGDRNLARFFQVANEEQVSFDCVEKLLGTMGYEIILKTHYNEKTVKRGIDK